MITTLLLLANYTTEFVTPLEHYTIDIRGRWTGNGCAIHIMVCINGLILYIWGFTYQAILHDLITFSLVVPPWYLLTLLKKTTHKFYITTYAF